MQEKATIKEHVMFMRERKRGHKQFDKVQKNVDIELPDLNGFPPRRLKTVSMKVRQITN